MNLSKNRSNFRMGNKKKNSFKPKNNKGKLEKDEINKLKQLKLKLGELDPVELTNFNLLPLSGNTQKGLLENNFTAPTKVQRQTLIHSLQGLDVVAAAKTGSGKTLAFIVPLLELLYSKLWSQIDGLGGLIITPTRELAYQIYEVLNKIGKRHNFSVGLVIGGKDLKFEWTRIQRCNIMICTPGRLLQHMTENPEFTCENVQLLVLDEADQCLSMGFAETMNIILDELPSDRQTLLFSATQTRDVKDLIRAGCKNPVFCSVHEHSKTVTPQSLKESYIVCDDADKITFLWSFLKNHKRHKILVFLATCKQVQFITELFTQLRTGVTVMGLHGGMHQLRRMAIYDEFCRKKHAVLFATDVASRGLDIPSVDWVIQMDCPEDVTTYIHRAGRTARHASSGEALLILTPSQQEQMVASLTMKNIPIEKIDVDPNKLQSIQLKVEFVLSKYLHLKEAAERAFKAYLKNIAHMKNKKVFNVADIDLDSYARSLGMTVTPRVRFIERQLKMRAQKGSKPDTQEHVTLDPKQMKTFNLGISQNDDSDDDFLTRSEVQTVSTEDDSNFILNELPMFAKTSSKVISKYDVVKKVLKNKLKLNKKTVFDADGEETTHKGGQNGEEVILKESDATGINIGEMQELLREQDKVDKKLNSQRLKEKHRKEKDRLREERKQREEEKKKQKEGEAHFEEEVNEEKLEEGGGEEEEEEEEYDSDLDTLTRDIIDDLPDPDAIYGQKREASNSESEDDDEAEEEEEEEKQKEDSKQKMGKRDFKGKRKAKQDFREAKRARVVADNDLNAISFNEKEDLALFLLKKGR